MNDKRNRGICALLNQCRDKLIGKRIADAQYAAEIELDFCIITSRLDEHLSKLDGSGRVESVDPKSARRNLKGIVVASS